MRYRRIGARLALGYYAYLRWRAGQRGTSISDEIREAIEAQMRRENTFSDDVPISLRLRFYTDLMGEDMEPLKRAATATEHDKLLEIIKRKKAESAQWLRQRGLIK